ncbi:hypothetical protein AB0I94_02250 [Streptomyces sp. NPDC050147]|uniref:hypothetical protein n=1 Tax=Streptomyces sp. NPDC050147 TaxID=3155513 RepID=UPI0034201201
MRRCTRGHFIPANTPTHICRCTLTPRRQRYRSHELGSDLWGQGLTARRKVIRTISLTGSFL